jgi:hypothetical protein
LGTREVERILPEAADQADALVSEPGQCRGGEPSDRHVVDEHRRGTGRARPDRRQGHPAIAQ